MVFIVIPPTDVDVGSPLDEKLMDTIRVDLDDLDTRTTSNTTAIGAIGGGGGGGGGGYNNMLYFDAPGTWTSPVTVAASALTIYQTATSGGNGGGHFSPGYPANGGLGGQATDGIFFGNTITGGPRPDILTDAAAGDVTNIVAPDFRISLDKATTSYQIIGPASNVIP